jgi:hypothetical protein
MTLYLAHCMISHLYFTADLLEHFWGIACTLNFPFESCKVQPGIFNVIIEAAVDYVLLFILPFILLSPVATTHDGCKARL